MIPMDVVNDGDSLRIASRRDGGRCDRAGCVDGLQPRPHAATDAGLRDEPGRRSAFPQRMARSRGAAALDRAPTRSTAPSSSTDSGVRESSVDPPILRRGDLLYLSRGAVVRGATEGRRIHGPHPDLSASPTSAPSSGSSRPSFSTRCMSDGRVQVDPTASRRRNACGGAGARPARWAAGRKLAPCGGTPFSPCSRG